MSDEQYYANLIGQLDDEIVELVFRVEELKTENSILKYEREALRYVDDLFRRGSTI